MNKEFSPQSGLTRRRFLYYSALAASATAITGCSTPKMARLNAGDKLRIAAVGGGGKGGEGAVKHRSIARCPTSQRDGCHGRHGGHHLHTAALQYQPSKLHNAAEG